jgi:hypothetical protein
MIREERIFLFWGFLVAAAFIFVFLVVLLFVLCLRKRQERKERKQELGDLRNTRRLTDCHEALDPPIHPIDVPGLDKVEASPRIFLRQSPKCVPSSSSDQTIRGTEGKMCTK